MSLRLRSALMGNLDALRHEPTAKRIRAKLGDTVALDTTRAVLVWEPRRIVPTYAVPVDDVRGELVPASSPGLDAAGAGFSMPELSQRPLLDPSVPFAAHTADGEAVDVVVDGRTLPGAGLRPADPDLAGYVVLDFPAFDSWYEEDEANVGHPRDPFHRIDTLPSSRHVRIEIDGQLVAESTRPVILFETMLPPRYYLPREDVRVELTPSDKRTTCAYKGHASYWSATVGGRPIPDIAWSYEQPLHDAAEVRGRISFFNERVSVTLDGQPLDRPVTPWSPPAAD